MVMRNSGLLCIVGLILAVVPFATVLSCKPDDPAPVQSLSMISVSPAPDEESVPVTTTVEAVFDSEIDPDTVGTSGFTLKHGDAVVEGDIATDGNSLVFTPSAPLLYKTTYTARVTVVITDTAGAYLDDNYEWDFTTEENIVGGPDPIYLSVLSVLPADGSVDVPLDSYATVTFDDPVDRASVSSATFSLTTASGSVPGNFTFAENDTVITFTPITQLVPGEQYTISLSTNLRNLSGEPLEAPLSASFMTLPPPEVISLTPDPASGPIPVTAEPQLVFSEQTDMARVSSGTVQVRFHDTQVAIGCTVSAEGQTATILPNDPTTFYDFLFETTYDLVLSTDIQTSSGIPLQEELVFTFTTETAPLFQVEWVNPENGYRRATRGTSVFAGFNYRVDPATLSESTVVVEQAGVPVSGARSVFGSAGTEIRFEPDAEYAPDTWVTVTITGVCGYNGGDQLDGSFSWQFLPAAIDLLTPQYTLQSSNWIYDAQLDFAGQNTAVALWMDSSWAGVPISAAGAISGQSIAWSVDSAWSADPSDGAPSLSANPAGTSLAAWMGGIDYAVQIDASAGADGTWGPVSTLLDQGNPGVSSDRELTTVVLDNSDSLILWEFEDATYDTMIMSIRRESGVWLAEQRLTSAGASVREPGLACDGVRTFAYWLEGHGDSTELHLTEYAEVSDTWAPNTTISSGDIRSVRAAMSPAGTDFIAWETEEGSYPDASLAVWGSVNTGSGWETAVKLSPDYPSVLTLDPEIACDDSGNGIVAWHDETTLHTKTYETGTAWTVFATSAPYARAFSSVGEIALAMESDGDAVLAWVTGYGGSEYVVLDRFARGPSGGLWVYESDPQFVGAGNRNLRVVTNNHGAYSMLYALDSDLCTRTAFE